MNFTEAQPPKDISGLAVTAIIDAIKASKQSVMTKVENTVTALSMNRHTEIESLSDELNREIATVHSKLHEVLDTTTQEIKLQATLKQCLEKGANHSSAEVVELQWQLSLLSQPTDSPRRKIWS